MTQAPAPIPLFDQDHETMAAAFEASATGICFLDSEGTLLRVNGALCDMLGHAPGTLNGRPWTVLAPPSLAARGTAFLASIAPDSALTSEWALTRADGSRLNAFVTVRSLVLANGTRRFMASFSDLDQRRDAEQKSLSRSNDLYRTVVEYVGEAIIIVQDGRISYANPRASELSGYNNHELLDKPFYSLIHPQDLARTVDRYQRSMAGMPISGRHAQFRILRRDGAERHVESSAVRIEREGRPALLAFLSDQTERQRQDMALMKSEQRHRQVVDNATEGIVVIQDGVIVFANRRTAEMAGVSIEQLQGRPFAATLHPNDQTAAAERYWRRLQGEPVPPNGVVRLHNLRTKAYVWLDVSVVMIDWEGRPATLSFLTDISARKALEDRLKQSLEERDTIVENAILGMVFLNPNGRVNWANGAMYQIFGVEPGTPTGSLERFYPSRTAYLRTGAAVAARVRDGEVYETELEMRRADGSPFWAYLSGRAVSKTDLSRGTVWVVMDITRRRELELALQKSEERYRQVVDHATECIFVVQDGRVVFSNRRLHELIGYTQEELLTLPYTVPIHPDDRARVAMRHQKRLRGEAVEQHYRFRVVHAGSRRVFWVELSAVMIEWEGRPATLSFMTDVTARKRLEDDLRDSAAGGLHLETQGIQNELSAAEGARRHGDDDRPDTAAAIRAALEQDRELAGRLAQALRAVSGLLGTGPLDAPLLGNLDSTLQQLQRAVEPGRATGPVQAQADGMPPANDSGAVHAMLQQLGDMLCQSDAAPEELLSRAGPLLTTVLGPDAWTRLARAVAGHDYQAALATLTGAQPDQGAEGGAPA